MESPSSLSKKIMKSSLEKMCIRNYQHHKNLVVQPEGSRNVYSPVASTSGMLCSRPYVVGSVKRIAVNLVLILISFCSEHL